ncbi:ZmpA/ZmpB/ZmpC family metallo-endopeptidase-related protein [Haploplasma modicum]|uniref:ZmpA/ZmpB/ZmpC family metallo-endopeptidase-related protein n=1 Tax=Haploplasma modicum TaxID=2150 RepID=UPI00214C27B9|nr:ZmpA/ZmpB/ZmpC family metallo-endopeptidase-related protein [Haploplasma modicum]MCR1808661.1 hypothetical protein [Haploplasma modicum]
MKKIGALIITLLLAVTLVGCNKDKTYAKAKFNNFENLGTSIKFDLKLEDPDQEVTSRIYIQIKEDGSSTVKEELTFTIKELEEEDKDNIEFKNLTVGKNYTVFVKATIGEKILTIGTKSFKANEPVEKTIQTVDEFFAISQNPNGHYTLGANLDFTGREEDIKQNLIRTFSGIFNGNNKTISNYKIDSTNTSIGLFGQLSSGAVVKDLIIDTLTIEPVSKVTGSRYVGILFGQAQSNSTKISNIIIKNSSIRLAINSESNYVKVGLLGGVTTAKINDVNIIDSNIDITHERIGTTRVGGLVGEIKSNVSSIQRVKVEANINVSVEQKADAGLRGEKNALYIGGIIGDASEVLINNVISKTNINVDKLDYVIASESNLSDENKKNPKDINLEANIGGLFGQSMSVEPKDMIHSGNIKVGAYTLDNQVKEKNENDEEVIKELKYTYKMSLNVGNLIGQTGIYNSSVKNLVRVGGLQEVAAQSNLVTLKTGTLFGISRNTDYNFSKNYGYINVSDVLEDIKEFTSLEEVFGTDHWIIENK